jgi:hypothetical protein
MYWYYKRYIELKSFSTSVLVAIFLRFFLKVFPLFNSIVVEFSLKLSVFRLYLYAVFPLVFLFYLLLFHIPLFSDVYCPVLFPLFFRVNSTRLPTVELTLGIYD